MTLRDGYLYMLGLAFLTDGEVFRTISFGTFSDSRFVSGRHNEMYGSELHKFGIS